MVNIILLVFLIVDWWEKVCWSNLGDVTCRMTWVVVHICRPRQGCAHCTDHVSHAPAYILYVSYTYTYLPHICHIRMRTYDIFNECIHKSTIYTINMHRLPFGPRLLFICSTKGMENTHKKYTHNELLYSFRLFIFIEIFVSHIILWYYLI